MAMMPRIKVTPPAAMMRNPILDPSLTMMDPCQMEKHHLMCNGQGPTVEVPRIAHEWIHEANARAAQEAAGRGAKWVGGFCHDPFTLRIQTPSVFERQTKLTEFWS